MCRKFRFTGDRVVGENWRRCRDELGARLWRVLVALANASCRKLDMAHDGVIFSEQGWPCRERSLALRRGRSPQAASSSFCKVAGMGMGRSSEQRPLMRGRRPAHQAFTGSNLTILATTPRSVVTRLMIRRASWPSESANRLPLRPSVAEKISFNDCSGFAFLDLLSAEDGHWRASTARLVIRPFGMSRPLSFRSGKQPVSRTEIPVGA
jgi:hypothetical protein